MLSDQAFDIHPIIEVHSPSGLAPYRPPQPLGWRESVRGPGTDTRYIAVVSHGSFGKVGELDLMVGMQAWKMAAATKKWSVHVLNPHAAADVDTLTETVEAILDFVFQFGPNSLSLKEIKYNFVQPEHLAAILRSTSTWRNQVDGWNDALEIAIAATKSAGLDPNDVLFGMV